MHHRFKLQQRMRVAQLVAEEARDKVREAAREQLEFEANKFVILVSNCREGSTPKRFQAILRDELRSFLRDNNRLQVEAAGANISYNPIEIKDKR